MQNKLFVYGTLQLPEKLAQIIGRTIEGTPATLLGYRCGLVAKADFPGIVPMENSSVNGLLLSGLTRRELLALDQYEGELYQRIQVQVEELTSFSSVCWVYVIAPWAHGRVTNEDWTVEWYRAQSKKRRLTYRY